MNRSHTSFIAGLFFVFMALILAVPGSATAASITNELKAVIDQVVVVVTDPKYKADKAARREKIRKLIDPKFDYEEMAKRSLRHDWKDRTPEEREAFVKLFGKLLENSYATKIESYQDEKITYGDEIIKGRYAMVKTKIVRKDGNIDVDYKLINKGNNWAVFDFIIEEVSMVNNFRSQFTKIIRKDSFATLMDKLQKKVDKLEKGADDSDDL